MEQKTLQQLKKRKLPKWLMILIAIPLIIIAIHFHFYSALKDEFHANQSVNPEATSYFLHATAVNVVWITVLHDYLMIDYDSSVLKPFLALQNHFFQKGESFMSVDNAEDAIWWVQNYATMYDFTVKGRDDKSMAIDTLDKPTQKAIREKIYNYIIKMDKYGVKGIHSGQYAIPADKMTDLVACYLHEIVDMYEGANEQEKVEKYYTDNQMTKKIFTIYTAYDNFINRFGTKKDDLYYFNYYKYRLLNEIVIRKIAATEDFSLHECDEFVNMYLQISNFMTSWTQSPESEHDAPSRRIKHDFKHMAISENPDNVANIVNRNINQQCPKQIQGVNNGK